MPASVRPTAAAAKPSSPPAASERRSRISAGHRLRPAQPEIYILRGIAYLEAENTASALKDFGTAIDLAPAQATAYALRGYANAKAEAFDDAISDFAKAVEIDPKAALAYATRVGLPAAAGTRPRRPRVRPRPQA